MTASLAALAGAIERDGFAFVRAPEMQALLADGPLCDWDVCSRPAGTISASTPTWPMAGVIAGGALRRSAQPRPGFCASRINRITRAATTMR